MKERPILFSGPMVRAILEGRKTQTRRVIKHQESVLSEAGFLLPCAKGDRLWVREAWLDAWAQNLPATSVQYHYRADPGNEHYSYKWRPSIHMPREACRLLLFVTDVRVQRLQSIDIADAIQEGALPMTMDDEGKFYMSIGGDYRTGFAGLWIHINGAARWEANPWVAAITFERGDTARKAG